MFPTKLESFASLQNVSRYFAMSHKLENPVQELSFRNILAKSRTELKKAWNQFVSHSAWSSNICPFFFRQNGPNMIDHLMWTCSCSGCNRLQLRAMRLVNLFIWTEFHTLPSQDTITRGSCICILSGSLVENWIEREAPSPQSDVWSKKIKKKATNTNFA